MTDNIKVGDRMRIKADAKFNYDDANDHLPGAEIEILGVDGYPSVRVKLVDANIADTYFGAWPEQDRWIVLYASQLEALD